jgi:hypothetical protein
VRGALRAIALWRRGGRIFDEVRFQVENETGNVVQDLERARRVLLEASRNKRFAEVVRQAFIARKLVRVTFEETPRGVFPCQVHVDVIPLADLAEGVSLVQELPQPMRPGEVPGWVFVADERGSSWCAMLAGEALVAPNQRQDSGTLN